MSKVAPLLFAAFAASCAEPVHDQQVKALGDDPQGIPDNEFHRAGQPCRKCGTAIVNRRHGADARNSYWCPECQKYRGEIQVDQDDPLNRG